MIRSLTAAGGALALLLTLGCGAVIHDFSPYDAPQQTAVEKPPEK